MALTKGKAAPIAGAEQQTAPAALADTTQEATGASIAGIPDDPTPANMTTTTQGGAVAPTDNTGKEVVQAIQNQGFASLDDEIRFGSFPMIKLEATKFQIGDVEEVESFLCHIVSVRKKMLFKAGRGDDKKSEEIFYSYDGVHDVGGTAIEARLADWKAQGLTQKETRSYQEVAVKMESTALEGSLALLSIPPVSAARLAGFRRQNMALKNLELDKYITKVSAGAKITTSRGENFWPWKFDFHMTFEDFEASKAEAATE